MERSNFLKLCFAIGSFVSMPYNMYAKSKEKKRLNKGFKVAAGQVRVTVTILLRAGRVVSGGSTISMQTIRLAYSNPPRTYVQKIMGMIATLKLELLYSKKAILKLYADHCPFGGNIVGINAASWRYFGRPPEKLPGQSPQLWPFRLIDLPACDNRISRCICGDDEEGLLIRKR